jgi:hypothetical protein
MLGEEAKEKLNDCSDEEEEEEEEEKMMMMMMKQSSSSRKMLSVGCDAVWFGRSRDFYKILLPISRTQHRYILTKLNGVTSHKTTMFLQSCSDFLRRSVIFRHDSFHFKQLSPVLNSRC